MDSFYDALGICAQGISDKVLQRFKKSDERGMRAVLKDSGKEFLSGQKVTVKEWQAIEDGYLKAKKDEKGKLKIPGKKYVKYFFKEQRITRHKQLPGKDYYHNNS